MKSQNIDYMPKLDHLRFLAAALVLLFHTALLSNSSRPGNAFQISLIDQGHIGVQLFMVISGFIMATIFAKRAIEPRTFYLNRMLRIYPLLILIVSIGYFSTSDPRPISVGIDYLMAMLPISNLYRLKYGEFGGQMWTVAVEIQFYLLMPLIFRFRQNYNRSTFYVAIIAIAIVLRAAMWFQHGTVHSFTAFTLFGGVDLFIGGMATADLNSAAKKRGIVLSPWLPLAIFLAVAAIVSSVFSIRSFFHVDYSRLTSDGVSQSPIWIFWPTLQAMLWGAALLSYLLAAGSIPASAQFAAFGRWSYSTYVWHILIIAVFKDRILWMSPYLLGVCVILPVTLLFSFLSYTLIEKPFLGLRRSYQPVRPQIIPEIPQQPVPATKDSH